MLCETSFLDRQAELGLSEDQGAYVIGILFEVGSGTTAVAMMSFILSVCHYPEWQDETRREVDRVVGTERMPGCTDIASLPTVRAVAKAVLRWGLVTAGGISHEMTKDDVYQSFFFPAATNVHANPW